MSKIQLTGEFLLYETEDGRTRGECRFIDETLWLTLSGMAELYQTSKQNIAKHLKAIFADGELAQHAVVNQWLTTATDGKRYQIGFYNLDAILAVGYRVRSTRGTQFRRWATERLREYLVKGFTMDDERLKNPPVAGSGVPDHFDELKDIFPKDWEEKLNAFLEFNDRNVLPNAGSLSKKQAEAHAEAEYAKFADQRRALLEADGEKYNLKMLETAAEMLPSRIRKPKPAYES